MVVIIAIIPTSIYFYMNMNALHERTQIYARQIGFLMGTHLEEQNPIFMSFSSRVWEVMKSDRIYSFRLVGADGKEIIQLGEPKQRVFAMTVEFKNFPPEHPIKTAVIQHDVSPLFLRTGRVFGVHLTVASVLTLLVYTFPMRALRQAVSDVKHAYAQVIQADKLSAIGEVYASLSHEINNPLSILLSRVKLLLRSTQNQQFSQELIHDLEVIERHGTRISDIVRGLLTFARKTPFKFVETNLNQVIAETVTLVEKPFAKEGVRITTALDPELPAFSGSPNHLQQVFLNFLNNARDAMPEGGQITIRTFATKTHVAVEIQDNGMGMAQDIRDKIFEPFFSTKKVGKGTGLGLPISYGIIRDHSGEIEVQSHPGEGTTFQVMFPREEVRR
jgi:signal transduction histidine kinase